MRESLPATWYTIFLSIILICGCSSNDKNKLKTIYSWKALDFAFPNECARETAIREGSFKSGAPVPIDVDFYHKGKEKPIVFVSIPRFQNGVPVTLGYVTDEVSSEGNPLIAPYPSWEWNKIGNCDTITSVYRMQVDECDRLWVLDTGRLGERQVCRPQLLLFSLSNHKLIKQYKFPRNQFKEDSLFVTTAVDVRDECHDTFVYIADVTGFSLIVYEHAKSRSWKIANKLFYPYPPHGTFDISNVSFDLMDGILGLALGPVRPDGDRILYFHSLASNVESWVATSVIRDYERFRDNPEATPRSFKTFNGERSSQSAAQVMDKNGILFFGLMSDLAIGCWNSMKFPHYGAKNLDKVVTDPETLQFPSGLKLVLSDSNREELWILTSSFQKYMDGSLRANETNFRIQAGFVDELVRGTKCNGQSRGNSTAPGGPFTFPKGARRMIQRNVYDYFYVHGALEDCNNPPRESHQSSQMAKMLLWLLSVSLLGSRQFVENPKAEAISQRLEAPRLPALQFNQPRYDFSKVAGGTDIAMIRRNPLEERTRSVYVGAHDQNALDQRYTDVTDNWNHLYGSTPISINPRLLYDDSPSHSNSPVDFVTGEIDDDYGTALSLVYAWSTIDFEFDDIDTRDYAIFDGSYIAENNLPLGLAIHSDRVFVTLPKWKDGIPATLTTIPKRSKAMSPKLRPYPDWTWHRAEKCNGLTSVFRIEIDECERLWVLDSGKVKVATKPEQLCKPALFIFDLTTDTMLRRYDLPEDQVKEDSLYSNIAVDVREGDCGAAVAYLSDVWRFGLVIYDLFKDSSFRIEHHLFYPEPLASRYQLHGLKFHWTDGIFGIALSPIDVNNDRTLFFHPMSSFREFAVSTSILREKESAQKDADKFTPIGRARAKDYGHSSGSVVDRNGVMFFNMVTRDSVWCWDTRKEYLPQNLGVIGTSNVSLVFPNDIKVDHEKEQNVWLLSNRLPMYLYGHLDSNKINYRIFKANTKDAVKGTVCDPNYMLVTSYGETYDEVTC